MPRIIFGTTVGWLVAATLHVGAQQPGTGALATPRSTAAPAGPQSPAKRVLPGTRPNVFATIQGNALSPKDEAITNTTVRLRDARAGQIVATAMTDQSGLFVFPTVEPGSYIVEIMGQDGSTVLAASQVLNVSPGEAVSAVVKLPFNSPAFVRIMGNSTPSLNTVTTQGAAAGILANQAAGTETCITLEP
jgi:hypothetical protein